MNTPRCRLAASIAGRLRLKFTEIHPAALAALQSDIAAIPSVREVQANAAARSLVVHYDASTPQALMEQRIVSLCGGADADQAKREPAPVVTKPTSALRSAPPAGLRRGLPSGVPQSGPPDRSPGGSGHGDGTEPLPPAVNSKARKKGTHRISGAFLLIA